MSWRLDTTPAECPVNRARSLRFDLRRGHKGLTCEISFSIHARQSISGRSLMPTIGSVRPHWSAAPVICLVALSGCTSLLSASTADVAGVVSAGISSGITKNAAVGTGIGLGVAAGASAGLQYAERRVHHAEQEQIARAAGPLSPGQVAPWSIVHTIPIEADQHGLVTVFRTIPMQSFTCKEIVFSVENDKNQPTAFYTTTICFNGAQWHWAEAEPATARWTGLQ
jgi:hypothetical protein